jgi:hypothetical protein
MASDLRRHEGHLQAAWWHLLVVRAKAVLVFVFFCSGKLGDRHVGVRFSTARNVWKGKGDESLVMITNLSKAVTTLLSGSVFHISHPALPDVIVYSTSKPTQTARKLDPISRRKVSRKKGCGTVPLPITHVRFGAGSLLL